MSKDRESFCQQLADFKGILVDKIKNQGHDIFIKETLQAVGESLPKTRRSSAREDTRYTAYRIIHSMILRFSRDDEEHNNTQFAGLYASNNIGAFFYGNHLEDLLNACQMNAGHKHRSLRDLLLAEGLTEAVAAWWPDSMGTTMAMDCDNDSIKSPTVDEDQPVEDYIVVQGLEEQSRPEEKSPLENHTSSSSNKLPHEQISALLDEKKNYEWSWGSRERHLWKTNMDKPKQRHDAAVSSLRMSKTANKKNNRVLKRENES